MYCDHTARKADYQQFSMNSANFATCDSSQRLRCRRHDRRYGKSGPHPRSQAARLICEVTVVAGSRIEGRIRARADAAKASWKSPVEIPRR